MFFTNNTTTTNNNNSSSSNKWCPPTKSHQGSSWSAFWGTSPHGSSWSAFGKRNGGTCWGLGVWVPKFWVFYSKWPEFYSGWKPWAKSFLNCPFCFTSWVLRWLEGKAKKTWSASDFTLGESRCLGGFSSPDLSNPRKKSSSPELKWTPCDWQFIPVVVGILWHQSSIITAYREKSS